MKELIAARMSDYIIRRRGIEVTPEMVVKVPGACYSLKDPKAQVRDLYVACVRDCICLALVDAEGKITIRIVEVTFWPDGQTSADVV